MVISRHRVPVTTLLVAVAVGSTAIFTPSIAARPTSSSGAGTAIAYTYCEEWGNYLCGVLIVGLADGHAVWLDYGIQPAWTTDGSRIAYADADGFGIFVADLRDGSRRQLTTLGWTPAWSPDGSRIAFAAGELYVIGSDGSGLVQLTENLGFAESPAWSPDGLTIAFDCEITGMRDLCAIRPDGTGLTRLTVDTAWDSGAAFSPDGTRIAFSTNRFSATAQIALMNTDGSSITSTGITGVSPAWSPDGAQLAHVVPFTGVCSSICPDTLYVSNLDGSGATLLGPGSGPKWATLGQPVAAFYSGECDGLTCGFDGSGSLADAAGIASYAWEFGDGAAASGALASHTYAAPGTYLVSLTVTDAVGVSGTTYQSVEVTGNQWPVASFTYSCVGSICAFDGTGSSDPDGTIAAYSWSFGDGSIANGATTSHRYLATGTYAVRLTVFDTSGAHTDQIQQVQIDLLSNQPPFASFVFSCTGFTCMFDSSASSDPDGQIASRVWNFGDGTTGTGTVVSHSYAAAGTWTVTLIVTDDMGASASVTHSVSVTPPPNPIHVGDLDGSSSSQKNTWTAIATVTVHDSSHSPVANAVVTGVWDAGPVTCTTNAAGQCTVTRTGLPKRTSLVSFTVTGVTHAIGPYQSSANHDPDGDSNGTAIKVSRP